MISYYEKSKGVQCLLCLNFSLLPTKKQYFVYKTNESPLEIWVLLFTHFNF